MDTPLRKVRKLKGITQARVAEAVGIVQSAYCKIEAGPPARARAGTAEKISQFFGRAVTEEHILYPERFPDFLAACGTKS